MSSPALNPELLKTVVLLLAAVVAVPLFRRIGLGAVLGYLAGGVVVGPHGVGFFEHPETILHVAELGVVMFLFIIGLEMQPSRLWRARRQIFGLGLAQVVVAGAALTVAGVLNFQLPWLVAFVVAMGFVLTSTAIVMQLLEERGEVSSPAGQRIVSILLFEDLAIVPLLAIVAFLAPVPEGAGEASSRWVTMGVALVSVVGLVAVSRWLLNPMFRVLARHGAREVMTAAALLVVLGAALAMQWGGLSMAMGAFAAGVMLSESSFRHQLEADVEPFRGLLLGLFFMGVGMSLDLPLVWANATTLLLGVLSFMLLKGAAIYAVARLARSAHHDALARAGLMAQGGEFAFVLYAAAAQAGILSAPLNATLTAAIILSMALTPLVMLVLKRFLQTSEAVDLQGIDEAKDLSGTVLVIGFGRFAQIVSQPLLARGVTVSIIEKDTEMIRAAARFGFRVFYGDGTRLDVLHASGAEHARAVLVCTDDREATTHIVTLLKHHFPLVKVLARAYDRQHAVSLVKQGVDFQLRETVESALAFGGEALQALGVDADDVQATVERVRELDRQRMQAEILGSVSADTTRNFMHTHRWQPTPLTPPKMTPNNGPVVPPIPQETPP